MRRAVILAGGRGTRLRPFTVSFPKPLMPVGDQPILEIIIRQLASCGFDHVTLAVNHQAELLKAFFADGSRWGIQIDYSLEHEPLGTMGPLRLIRDLPEDVLVMNGDILSDIDYAALLDAHVAAGRLFTIATAARHQYIDYGVLKLVDARVVDFVEKPSMPYDVSMGVYCLSRAARERIPVGSAFGFDQLVLALLAEDQAITASPHPGYWLDIGRPEDYQKAIEDWPTLKAELKL